MITEILLAAGTDPTISVGGILKSIQGNIRVGKSDFFVTEACEYTNSFLSFYPRIGIILNIEEDHLDFSGIWMISVPPSAVLHSFCLKTACSYISGDISDYEEITRGLSCSVLTFGSDSSCDYYYDGISHDEFAHASFTPCTAAADQIFPVSLGVPGAT